ncbi:MAG TPA: AMP-binding protein, partial [Gammaproteobacteria bacterium]
MSSSRIIPVPASVAERAHIGRAKYRELYRRSIEQSDAFWAEQAEKFVTWTRRWDRVQDWNFTDAKIRWFDGGRLNVAANCLDRHLAARSGQIAILWEGDDPAARRTLTYGELHDSVCRFANVLKARGVKRGDRVSIYLPMIPEVAVAMLACARIGAIHSVVFAGFSAEALKDRILDSDCHVVVTADEGLRGGRATPLKANTDEALLKCPGVHSVIVVRRTGGKVPWNAARDVWYHD